MKGKPVSSNTAKKQRGKPFVKGDSRINKNGRPKAFDFIRELAQKIGNEVEPVIRGKLNTLTNAEIVLRQLMMHDGAKFIEVAYGKTPQSIELDANVGIGPSYESVREAIKIHESEKKRQRDA